jgi:hypothetical protein
MTRKIFSLAVAALLVALCPLRPLDATPREPTPLPGGTPSGAPPIFGPTPSGTVPLPGAPPTTTPPEPKPTPSGTPPQPMPRRLLVSLFRALNVS